MTTRPAEARNPSTCTDTSIPNVDAFVGMTAEPHLPGSDFGELQLAIWTRQFQALRDGDRFFYGNDPVLRTIRDHSGINYRQSLGQIIAENTDADDEADTNVFLVEEEDLPAASCTLLVPAAHRRARHRRRTPTTARTARWATAATEPLGQG